MRGETFNDKVFSAFPWTEGNPIGYVKKVQARYRSLQSEILIHHSCS